MKENSRGDYDPIYSAIVLIKLFTRFPLGDIAVTHNATELVHPFDALHALARHSQCDWGDIDPEDKGLNEQALIEDTRLLSVYKDGTGETFWIITEADRSVTTILMPEDY